MTHDEQRKFLGRAAHEHVRIAYQCRYPRHHLISDQHLYFPKPRSQQQDKRMHLGKMSRDPLWRQSVTLNSFNNGTDNYLACVRLALQTTPGFARRPDLADIERHVAWEVKPDNSDGRREGRMELITFLQLLRVGDRDYHRFSRGLHFRGKVYAQLLSRVWRPEKRWVPPALEVKCDKSVVRLTFRNEKGVILWADQPK